MSDAELGRNFSDLADGILPADQTRRAMDLCWGLETLESTAEIARCGAAA